MKKHFILLSLLFVSTSLAQTTGNAAVCNDKGVMDNSQCSCYSGWSDSSCATTNSSCDWLPIQMNTTVGEPIVANLVFDATGFTVVIAQPFVENRWNTSITFIGGSTSCNYPGDFWTKTISDCKDSFTARLSWTEAALCGIDEDSVTDPNWLLRTGRVSVESKETTGTLRGTPIIRVFQNTLQFQVSFAKQVTLSSANLQVFAPIALYTATQSQRYNTQTQTLTLVIATSLQQYFKINTTEWGSLPAGMDAVEDPLLTGDCVAGAVCNQQITLKASPSPALCDISGAYSVVITFACVDPNNCPTITGDGTIIATISASPLCTSARTNITASGSVKLYQNPGRTDEKTDFFQDDTIYGSVIVSSTAPISAVDITAYRVTDNNGDLVDIWIKPNATLVGTLALPSVSVSGLATTAYFQFDAVSSLIAAPVDGKSTAREVQVDVTITYGVAKRGVVARAGNSEQRTVLTNVNIGIPTVTTGYSNDVIDAYESSGNVVNAGVALLVAVAAVFA